MKNFTKIPSVKLLILAVLFVFSKQLAAQDTVISVPIGIVDGKGALYEAIMGDVDDNGDRLYPNATYRLARDQVYPIPEMGFNFNITIDAEEGEGRPPMIIPEGNDIYTMLRQSKSSSFTLKGLIISGIGFDKSIVRWGLYVAIGKVVIEDCIFNGFDNGAICGMGVDHYNVQVNNSIFRNCQGVNNWWEGTPLMFWDGLGDTLIVTNSTFFNNTSTIISDNTWFNHGSNVPHSFYTKHYRFCYNTVYGSGGGQTSFAQTNSEISNNLFINTFAIGIDTAGYEHGEGAWPGEQTCIVPVSENDTDDMKAKTGVESNAERKIVVQNNVYFWSQEVLDNWAARGELFPPVSNNPTFMNERSQTMFDDSDAYPLFEESGNIEADPMFIDSEMETKVIAGFNDRADVLYDFEKYGTSFPYERDDFVHHYPGESGISNIKPIVEWPLAEDLTYTNEALMTYSTTGGQVGDPRWFSEDTVGINVNKVSKAFMSFNYPNPFTNHTTIKYTINNASSIKLTVYDIYGKELRVLVNQHQHEGVYRVEFDASYLSSGIYLYRLQNDSYSEVKQMILVK